MLWAEVLSKEVEVSGSGWLGVAGVACAKITQRICVLEKIALTFLQWPVSMYEIDLKCAICSSDLWTALDFPSINSLVTASAVLGRLSSASLPSFFIGGAAFCD